MADPIIVPEELHTESSSPITVPSELDIGKPRSAVEQQMALQVQAPDHAPGPDPESNPYNITELQKEMARSDEQSPQQQAALQAELQSRLASPQPQIQSVGITVPEELGTSGITVPSELDQPTGAASPVGTLAYVAHHAQESMRQLAISGGQLAATVGMPNALDSAMSINQGKPYTSPEEEQGRSGAEQFMGKVGDMAGGLAAMVGVGGAAAATLATAGVAAPLGLAAMIGGGAAALEGGLERGRASIDQGTDQKTAIERSVFTAAVGAAANMVPIVGTTLGRSFMLGGGSQVVSGIVTQAGDKALTYMNDYKDISGQTVIFDKNTAWADFVIGGTMGMFAHKFTDVTMTPEQRTLRDAAIAMKKDPATWTAAEHTALNNLAQTFDLPTAQTFSLPIPEGKTMYQTWKDHMWGDNASPFSESNIRDSLLAIASPDSPAPANLKVLAQSVLRMGNVVGMMDTKINLHNDEMFPGSSPGERVTGSYDPNIDRMTLHESLRPNQIIETTLHETTHAITSAAIKSYNRLTSDGTQRVADIQGTDAWKQMSPESQVLMGHLEKLNDNYWAAKDQWEAIKAKEPNKYSEKDTKTLDYTFKNLDEYTARSMTNELTQRVTNGFKVDPASATGPNVFFKIHNRFLEHKNAIMAMLTGGEELATQPQITALTQAQDHIYRVMNDMTEAARRNAGATEGLREANQAIGQQKDNTRKAQQAELQRTLMASGQWETAHAIAELMKNSGRFEEFKARMQMRSIRPAWREFVEKNAQHLWDKSDAIVAATEKNHQYAALSAEIKKIIGDPRSVDEMMKDIKSQLPEGDKIPAGNQDSDMGGTWLFSPDQLRMIKGSDNLAGQIYSWFQSEAQQYRTLKAQVYAEWKMRNDGYTKLPFADKLKMMAAVAYYDHGLGQMELRQKKLQWPTREILQRDFPKLNEAQLNAYEARSSAMDWMWDRMNDIRNRNSQTPLDKVPGYMPHNWAKPYKVMVERHILNPDGLVKEARVVEMHDFETHFFANMFVKRLQSGRYNGREGQDTVRYLPAIDPDTKLPIRWQKPGQGKPTADFLNDLGKQLNTFANKDAMGPEVMASLEKMHSDNLVGYSKHLLERTNVKGFIGDTRELTGATKFFNLVDKHAYDPHVGFLDRMGMGQGNKMIDLDLNYAKSLSEYYGNSLFMKEVVDPLMRHMVGGPMNAAQDPFLHQQLWGNMLDNLHGLKEQLRDYTHNFTGQNLNYLAFLDREIGYEPVVLAGLSPTFLSDSVNVLKNSFSLLKLRGNPGFYLGNVVQQLFSAVQLSVVNSILKRNGMQTVSIFRSLAEMAKELPEMSLEMRDALQWARDNHVLESLFEAELRNIRPKGSPLGSMKDVIHKATGGDINPWIEDKGRTNSFLYAYKHFRMTGFSEEHSKVAAAQIMRQTMTDYMRESRPLMFQNTGLLGKAASPFQVYHSAALGNMFMAFKALKQSGFKDWGPIMSTMTMYGLTAGAVGIPLMAETNSILEWLNEEIQLHVNPQWHIPTPYEMMRKTGFPEWMMFGGVSEATKALPGMEHGMYVGSSMNAVSLDESIPKAMAPYIEGLLQTAKFLALAAGAPLGLTRDLNRQDLQDMSKTLVPSALQGMSEWALMPEGSDVAPASGNLKGEYEREAPDWAAKVSGRNSITETIARKDTQIVETRVKQKQEMVKAALQSLVDHQVGKISLGNSDRQWEVLTSPDLGGLTQEEVSKRIAMIVAEQGSSAVVKDADLSNYEGAWRRQIRDDLRIRH